MSENTETKRNIVPNREVRLTPVSEVVNTKASDVTRHVIETVGNIQIKTKLKQILAERKMTQAELVRLTGIPKNQMSAFVNNKADKRLGYHHIMAIMIALRLTEIDQLLYVELDEDIVEQFNKERELWIETRREPSSIQQLAAENEKLG